MRHGSFSLHKLQPVVGRIYAMAIGNPSETVSSF